LAGHRRVQRWYFGPFFVFFAVSVLIEELEEQGEAFGADLGPKDLFSRVTGEALAESPLSAWEFGPH
jgi:hypothetical protein